MDRDQQEEVQFVGLFGICSKSIKIISRWRNVILVRICGAFLFPLSLVFLANINIGVLLSGKITHNDDQTRQGTASYNKISDLLTTTEWTECLLIKVVYFRFLLILSLLSTSAFVYTIIACCIASRKDITSNVLKRVMVTSNVLKTVMVTILCNFTIFIVYTILTFLFLIALIHLLVGDDIGRAVVGILYLIGLVYISVIGQLASVVSVFEEESYGFQALIKSKALIKGKMGASVAIFLAVNLCLFGTQLLFQWFVVVIHPSPWLTVLSLGLLCEIFLYGLVSQTVIYFVCKSYHHQNIDKSFLLDHLEVYLEECLPLKARDMQVEQA